MNIQQATKILDDLVAEAGLFTHNQGSVLRMQSVYGQFSGSNLCKCYQLSFGCIVTRSN